MTTHTATIAGPVRSKAGSGIHVGGLLGYGAIWAFMILFLIYPLLHLFYDTFTTDAGDFTLLNFQDFFTDRYYLKALMNSLLLGWGRSSPPPSSASPSPSCCCAMNSRGGGFSRISPSCR